MAQPKLTRDQKAERIIANDGVNVVNARLGEYLVHSESTDDLYHVSVPAQTCECTDFQNGFCCKHLRAAERVHSARQPQAPTQPTRTLDQYLAWATA